LQTGEWPPGQANKPSHKSHGAAKPHDKKLYTQRNPYERPNPPFEGIWWVSNKRKNADPGGRSQPFSTRDEKELI